MTLRTNARVAGVIFLLYIVTAIGGLILFRQASGGADTAARLASIAQHAGLVRLTGALTLVEFLYPMVLAVTIYALTREVDRDLALLAASCRFAEGVIVAMAAGSRLELLSVATSSAVATGAKAAAANALGGMLLGDVAPIAAFCFIVGSTIYCSLFLRGRLVPRALAWLGLVGSSLVLVALPLQIAGVLPGRVTNFLWIPVGVFELGLGVWLIAKGVAVPGNHVLAAVSRSERTG